MLASSSCLLALGLAGALPPGWRAVLLVLIGLLLLALGFLIAHVAVIRRRPPAPAPRFAPPPPVARSASARTGGSSTAMTRSGGQGALAVVARESGPMMCPACRREFDDGVRFCPHDARRLVARSDLFRSAELVRAAGGICPRCRRAFEPGVRVCPHDTEELIPLAVWEATRGRKSPAPPTGVVGKICPQCAGKYDLASTFCGRDGSELVTIN